jgi:PAS domain S-box-containing protein
MAEIDFLNSLDLVSQAMNNARDIDHVIEDVLDTVSSIFGCDRIWLFYPCDPDAPTFRVLAERNRSEYPGAFTTGQELPITPDAAKTIKKTINSGAPVVFDSQSGNKVDDVAASFSVRSQMMMAVHPKAGKPWMFGMHQCAFPRIWTPDEQLLFKEISFRVVESLNNLIFLRDLKKSELKYRRFFATVKNGWAYHQTVTNADGSPVDYLFLEVNKGFEELTGLASERIVGQRATQVLSHDPKTMSDWIDKFGRVSLTGESITFEGYFKPTDIWYSVSVSRPEAGHIITVFENISKRKRTEETLRESEERYALALRAANVGTWDWDFAKGSIKWSERTESIFGYAKGQFGETYDDVLNCVHPEDRQHVIDSINDALFKGKEYNIEHRIIWRDKSVQWVAEEGKVFRDKKGTPLRMVGVVHDITARKESFEAFRTILDSIDSLVYVADMETYELLFVNKYGRDIWGDITGKTCWETLQADQQGPCGFCTNNRLIDRDANLLGPYIWEFKNTVDNEWYECRDQAIRWFDGRIVRMEIASNITQRKVAEEQKRLLEEKLRQAMKMEAIGTLAGGIAHDFNNILSAILGYAELARGSSTQFPAIRHNLDGVIKAADRAKKLVTQILAFSRQADTQRIVLRPAAIIKEAIKMLRPSLPSTIEINLNIDAQTGSILADPTQIHQILMNLSTNAFHAMEYTGGRLDISLKQTTLNPSDLTKESGVEAGDFVQLSVRDSGPGIDPEFMGKIFDPYFTTKESGKGTGMGLSVVHGIVKSHGGIISVESEPGKGTTMNVFLPMIKMDEEIEKVDTESLPLGSEHILFVDDEQTLADLGKIMLEGLGYKVTACTKGRRALEIYQDRPNDFDLVITDQTMPVITGLDLASRMIQIRPDLPIILCTGYSSIVSKETAEAIGIKAFVNKPLSRKDIAQLIRKVLD